MIKRILNNTKKKKKMFALIQIKINYTNMYLYIISRVPIFI